MISLHIIREEAHLCHLSTDWLHNGETLRVWLPRARLAINVRGSGTVTFFRDGDAVPLFTIISDQLNVLRIIFGYAYNGSQEEKERKS